MVVDNAWRKQSAKEGVGGVLQEGDAGEVGMVSLELSLVLELLWLLLVGLELGGTGDGACGDNCHSRRWHGEKHSGVQEGSWKCTEIPRHKTVFPDQGFAVPNGDGKPVPRRQWERRVEDVEVGASCYTSRSTAGTGCGVGYRRGPSARSSATGGRRATEASGTGLGK